MDMVSLADVKINIKDVEILQGVKAKETGPKPTFDIIIYIFISVSLKGTGLLSE